MKTKLLVLCSLFAAIIAILAQLAIPMPSGVPFTLQILGVILSGIILGPKYGFIAVLIYVILGAVGLPVFANGSGGLGILFGPTGGFIISFPIMALIIGQFSTIKKLNKYLFVGIVMAALINYLVGCIQFMNIIDCDLLYAASVCVLPFITFDLIKWIIAFYLGKRIRVILEKKSFHN